MIAWNNQEQAEWASTAAMRIPSFHQGIHTFAKAYESLQ